MTRSLRVAICGSGNRSRTVWQPHVRAMVGMELVGIQDPGPEALRAAVALGNVNADQVFVDLGEMLDRARADALIVCPVHAAHAAAIETGLLAGCHVLVEKPFTTDLRDAVRLAELASRTGRTLAVVQNWRVKSVGRALQRAIAAGVIGEVSHLFFRYMRDRELPHLPPYLFEEEDPLLYAMAIHHFDLFRFALGQQIVRVEGKTFRPRWSRYQNPSGMNLWMETDGGVVITYTATFSSRNGHLPLESLIVEGETGSLCNESDYSEPPLLLSRRGEPAMQDLTADIEIRDSAGQYAMADWAILSNFRDAIRNGTPLFSSGSENLGTLAVIEAVRDCCREGRAIDPRAVLEAARQIPPTKGDFSAELD